jgi:hypothetical protein
MQLVKTGSSIFTIPFEIPATFAFHKHAFKYIPGVWKFAKYGGNNPVIGVVDSYEARAEAVKLKRTYITQNITVPEWLEELTK